MFNPRHDEGLRGPMIKGRRISLAIEDTVLSYVEVQSDKAHYLVVSFILSFCQLLRAAK